VRVGLERDGDVGVAEAFLDARTRFDFPSFTTSFPCVTLLNPLSETTRR
jgi:hypothetical protein